MIAGVWGEDGAKREISRPPAADVLDGAEGLGDGFFAAQGGEGGGEGAEIGEQMGAGTASQEAEVGDAILGFGPAASDDWARQSC